jgi:hypothetical protein
MTNQNLKNNAPRVTSKGKQTKSPDICQRVLPRKSEGISKNSHKIHMWLKKV